MKPNQQLSFKTNFNKCNLLRKHNQFTLEVNNNIINFTLPTVGELYDSIEEYDIVLALMATNPEEFDSMEMGFVAKTNYQLFMGISLLNPYYTKIISNFFSKFIKNFTIEKDNLKINNITIDELTFDILSLFYLIGCGKKPYSAWEDFLKKEQEPAELDDLSKSILAKIKKSEEKIRKIKEGAQNQKDKSVDLEMVILSIIYELPSIRLDDIFEMNYYTLFWFYHNVPKLIDCKIQTVAAGNGLAKQFTYFA